MMLGSYLLERYYKIITSRVNFIANYSKPYSDQTEAIKG